VQDRVAAIDVGKGWLPPCGAALFITVSCA
jgi:hypothetical protein